MGREPWQPWGLSFESPVFDRIRTCRNDCAFCFMSQLPGGLRPSLYLRDDDFRLSFLSGTFITLTNLTDADMARIATQRLSPLHVSLHAVTPAVREVLVCAHGEDCALERFDELVAAGIELHVQIVLVPGVNDGEELERTVTWLAERGEEVASVGIVPLGYTRHQDRFTHSFGDPASAAALLDAVAPWQTRMRTERDLTWLQAADEFYLAAGRPMPPEDDYDGYPQYENGIGMVRSFEDEWAEALADARGYDELTVDVAPATAVTGELFAPVLRRLVAQAGLEPRVSVLAVPNAAFGGNVTVAGLLTGADIAATIAADGTAAAETRAADAPYLVPDLVLNDDGLTLDDMTLSEVAEKAGAALNLVSSTAASLLMALGAVHPDSGPGEI
jgi:putative radical SAM enzyme (TIGR03279 family)